MRQCRRGEEEVQLGFQGKAVGDKGCTALNISGGYWPHGLLLQETFSLVFQLLECWEGDDHGGGLSASVRVA